MSWYQIDFEFFWIPTVLLMATCWIPLVRCGNLLSFTMLPHLKFIVLSTNFSPFPFISCVSYKFLKALLHMKEYCIYILISSLVFRLFSPNTSLSILFLAPFHSSTSPKNHHILKWILHKSVSWKKVIFRFMGKIIKVKHELHMSF